MRALTPFVGSADVYHLDEIWMDSAGSGLLLPDFSNFYWKSGGYKERVRYADCSRTISILMQRQRVTWVHRRGWSKGVMTELMRGLAEEVDVGVRGPWSLNYSLVVQEMVPDLTISPARVDPERDVVIGDGSVTYSAASNGYELTGGDISLESARLVRYRPGGLSYAGILVRVPDDPPSGVLDFGLGGVPYQDWVDTGAFGPGDAEVGIRLNSDGDWAMRIRRDDVDTIIPQFASTTSYGSQAQGRSWNPTENDDGGNVVTNENGDVSGKYWAFDAMDGSGPGGGNRCGLDLSDRPTLVLLKVIGTWYGKGPYYIAFETAASGGWQRAYPAVAFQALNDSIMSRASLPLMARYDSEGSGGSYDFQVYGRQGSGTGPVAFQPKTPWNWQSGVSYGTDLETADLIVAYRRAPESAVGADVNFRGTVYGVLDVDVTTDERSVVFASFDIDFGGQTPAWGPPTSVENQEDTSIQVATEDDQANRLTADWRTGVAQEASKVDAGVIFGAAVSRVRPAEQPNSRTQATGIFAVSTSGQSVTDSDWLVVFEEEGA